MLRRIAISPIASFFRVWMESSRNPECLPSIGTSANARPAARGVRRLHPPHLGVSRDYRSTMSSEPSGGRSRAGSRPLWRARRWSPIGRWLALAPARRCGGTRRAGGIVVDLPAERADLEFTDGESEIGAACRVDHARRDVGRQPRGVVCGHAPNADDHRADARAGPQRLSHGGRAGRSVRARLPDHAGARRRDRCAKSLAAGVRISRLERAREGRARAAPATSGVQRCSSIWRRRSATWPWTGSRPTRSTSRRIVRCRRIAAPQWTTMTREATCWPTRVLRLRTARLG